MATDLDTEARRHLLQQYISTVLTVYENPKYTLFQGLWYIKNQGQIICFGQVSPYLAWQNAAHIILHKRKKLDKS